MSCGIYAIVNKVNGKRYIGKSVNIELRWVSHISILRRKPRCKDCNRHLYNAFQKYGEECFRFEYLEVLENSTEDVLKEQELFWIEYLKTDEREFGYNLRKDSSTKCFVSEETRQLISENNQGENNPNYGNKWTDEQKKNASEIAKKLHTEGRYSSEETRLKHSVWAKDFWANNPEKKKQMAQKVSKSKNPYKIAQYTREGDLVRIWNSMMEVITENPDYHDKAIYSCINGHKKTYRNFVWKRFT